MALLGLIGFAAFVVAIIGLAKGNVQRLRIHNRKTSALVLAGSILLIGIAASGSEEPASEVAEDGEATEAEENGAEEREASTVMENDNEAEEETRDEEAEQEDREDVEMVEVDLDESISIDDDQVQISGTTNLEDGTLLALEVEHLSNPDHWIEEEVEVDDGEFQAEIDIADFTDGEIHVWLAFLPYMQNDDLQDMYGEMGEHIEGEQVTHNDNTGANEIIREETYTKSNPIELSGSGDTATETFHLSGGFAVFDMEYTADRNFIVELKNDQGATEELLVNHIGSYAGKTFALIPAEGEYLLDIDSSGSWEAHITQTIPEDVPDEPHTFEGSGDDVLFVELDSGMKRFAFTHDGESNFIVTVNGQALLVNDIGAYEGSTTENVQDDAVYVITVQADGNWTISVED